MNTQEILKNYFQKNIIELLGLDSEAYLCEYDKYQVKIIIPKEFPKLIPEFFIENYSNIDEYYTHISSNGKICYIAEDNLVWDIRNSEGLLKDCCEKVLDVIDSWTTPQMRKELREEFLSYWMELCTRKESSYLRAKGYIEEFTKFGKLNLAIFKNSLYIFNEGTELRDKVIPSFDEGIETYLLPIRKNNQIIPPNPKKELNSLTFKKMITGNLSSGVRKAFKKWSRKKRKKFILIIALPVHEGNTIFIGAKFEYSKECFPLIGKNKDICKVTPLLIEREDISYQIDRTSQDFSLINKKVAVIGLGSVGSFVASNLSKLGVSKLFMIDPDYLSIDNISRHYLGMDSLKQRIQKVVAMEDRLLLENPMLDIESEGIKFQLLISENSTVFDEYDVIVSCVGDTMTNFEINHFFRKKAKPVIYSWLDPYGIGSHILVVQPQFEGCYMCLNYEQGRLVSNRLSFAEPNQKFEKRLASCNSSFIPYNVVGPSQLASKTIEHFLLFLNEKYQDGNVFSSNFGLSMQFDKQGFRYSNRYHFCKANPQNLESTLQKNHFCPECNGEYNVC